MSDDPTRALAAACRQHWRMVYAANNAAGWRARADELRREADICDAQARGIEKGVGIVPHDIPVLDVWRCPACREFCIGRAERMCRACQVKTRRSVHPSEEPWDD